MLALPRYSYLKVIRLVCSLPYIGFPDLNLFDGSEQRLVNASPASSRLLSQGVICLP